MSLSDLPLASGQKHKKVLVKEFGWVVRKDGNHIVLTHANHRSTLSLPNHRVVKRPLLHDQLQRFGCTDEEYRAAFDRS